MRTVSRVQALVAGVLFLALACSEQETPTAPSTQSQSPPTQLSAQGTLTDPVFLARGVRGFGGFFVDERGVPVVYLKNAAERGKVERALAPYLRSEGMSTTQLRVLPARYEWTQLESW